MVHAHDEAERERYQGRQRRTHVAVAVHDRIDPVTDPQIPDHAADPGDGEPLHQRKRAQRTPFRVHQLTFPAPPAQQRVNERRHGYPAQEIEGSLGENKDLQAAGQKGQSPSFGGNFAH